MSTVRDYLMYTKKCFAVQIRLINSLETREFKERSKDSEVDVVSGNNVLFGRRGATRRWGKGNNAGEKAET